MREMVQQGRLRRAVAMVVFAAALIINPMFFAACGGDATEDTFSFGQQDMFALALKQTDWGFTNSAGDEGTLTLKLEQSPQPVDVQVTKLLPGWLTGGDAITSAHACGTRTFVSSASACVSVSELHMKGTLTLRWTPKDGSAEEVLQEVPLQALMVVYGEEMNNADVYGKFDAGTFRMVRDDSGKLAMQQLTASKVGADMIDVGYTRPE